jgi:23S rRNA (pseudouridine1915-N3)-methyltransferase
MWPAEDRPVRAFGGGRDKDPKRVLRLEAAAVMRHVETGWRVVVLDEHGRARTSEEFAQELQELAGGGVEGVVFAVGSDLGLHRDLLERADDRLSLSSMTLPHLVARLVLWEQLFRAVNIVGGGAYHRVSVQ